MPGMLGPRMSASMSPIQPPICWSATARFTLTVDLPTPPLPLPTAMTWRIPGSCSGPADARDDAPGACWLLSCGSVVCIPPFPSHRARWPLLHLDLDVGSRHANAVSHSGSLGRRTYDLARPNVECGAVPGAGHFVPRPLSIGERPAAVSAGVVEREELAVDVEQGNLLALHLDQTRLTRPDLSCPRCLHKVSHRSFPSITFLQPREHVRTGGPIARYVSGTPRINPLPNCWQIMWQILPISVITADNTPARAAERSFARFLIDRGAY